MPVVAQQRQYWPSKSNSAPKGHIQHVKCIQIIVKDLEKFDSIRSQNLRDRKGTQNRGKFNTSSLDPNLKFLPSPSRFSDRQLALFQHDNDALLQKRPPAITILDHRPCNCLSLNDEFQYASTRPVTRRGICSQRYAYMRFKVDQSISTGSEIVFPTVAHSDGLELRGKRTT